MADQDVLTQQEIDALLEQAPEAEQPEDQISWSEYKLGWESYRGPIGLVALGVVAERFSTVLSEAIEELFGCEVRVGGIGRDQQSFEKLSEAAPEQTASTVFRLAPMPGLSLLVLEGDLIHRLVDHYFSGPGEVPIAARPFSPSEQRQAERLSTRLLEGFSGCWDNLLNVSARVEGTGSKLSLMNQLAGDEQLLALSFVLEHENWQSKLWVALSARGVSAFQDQLSQAPPDQDPKRRRRWFKNLAASVLSADVPLRCQIATAELTLRDIVALSAGDVVPADVPEHHRVYVGPVAVMNGSLGESRGRLALEVTSVVQRRGEE